MRAAAFVTLPLLLALARLPSQPAAQKQPPADDGLVWTDATALTVEGRGWPDAKPAFARLPETAEKLVRKEVWSLSRHSAGLAVRFRTDATAIHAKWELTSKRLAMDHMPATGVSGLDLYVRHQGKWRWLGVGRPTAVSNTASLVKGLPAGGTREFLLYLPLYNGVKSLTIGVPRGAKVEKAPARPAHKKPIVVYGTSITQGGCASRPGMVHTAILGRRFDWPERAGNGGTLLTRTAGRKRRGERR